MTTPSIVDTLKYANLQMAAEALFTHKWTQGTVTPDAKFDGQITTDILTDGNLHASKFTPTEAAKFVAQWEVVEHISNTKTGFSGTLFRDKDTKELVLSIRSTEFLDDAARDNQATNVMEIKAFGWAFGQISDMEDWYASLKASGKIPSGSSLNVTGYSLGGHLATAFNLLHPQEVAATYTFNGAGVGTVNTGVANLRGIIDTFNLQRKNADGQQIVFADPGAKAAFETLRSKFVGGVAPTAADLINLSNQIDAGEIGQAEGKLLFDALTRIKTITDEIARLTTLNSGTSVAGEPNAPAPIPAANVEATRLDYQLAVLIAQKNTQAFGNGNAIVNITADGRNTAGFVMPNSYDVYGATYPSVVASSQLHYGVATPIFIEDQPFYRGTVIADAIKASYEAFDVKLLVNGYANNDFGDTHSLVLMVDSLNIQNTLKTLDPTLNSATLNSILKAASAATKETMLGGQGKAEGDVLENILNALCKIVLGPQAAQLTPKLDGNTWANFNDRTAFYSNLNKLTDPNNAVFKSMIGKVIVSMPDTGTLSTAARTDFASLLTLLTLSPFALKAIPGNEAAVETVLGTPWSTEYAEWQADQALTPGQRAQGQGNYTELFLADRSAMLSWIIRANTENLAPTNGKTIFDGSKYGYQDVRNWEFTNLNSNPSLSRTIFIQGSLIGGTNQIIFGSEIGEDASKPIAGGLGDDRLYGMAGDDKLDGGKGDDHLEGNAGNDTLVGGEGRDTLLGGLGDDRLDGGKGSDILNGGLGDDTYTVGGGNGWDWLEDKDGIGKILYADSQGGADIPLTGGTAVTGTDNVWKQESNGQTFWYILTDWTENGETFKRLSIEGPDGGVFIKRWNAGQLGIVLPGAQIPPAAPAVLAGTAGTDKLHAQHGEPVITGNGGADLLESDNVITVLNDAGTALYADGVIQNLIQYVADTAQLTGGGYLEPGALQSGSVLIGHHTDDTVVGGAGNDALFGGSGRDQLIGGGGADFILGDGIYHPVLNLDGTYAGWQLPLELGTFAIVGNGETEPFKFPEVANDDADIIHGGGGNDMVWGGYGDDLIYGEAGDDWLVGANGSDLIDGGDGNDLLVGEADHFDGPAGNDTLIGGKGNDNLYGYTGEDRLQGGNDDDLLVGDMPTNLGIGVDGHLDGNDFLDGESGNDRLFGGGKDDELYGGSGDDYLDGDGAEIIGAYMGKDTLDGGDGNDELCGDGNNDQLLGGNGDDLLFGDKDTTPLANQGNDYLDGGNGNDYLRDYGGDDTLLGGAGKDELLGGVGNDQLDGGNENDRLFGEEGDDLLVGGSGDDQLFGEQGNDTLVGGTGADLLDGGAGDDVYFFSLGDGARNAQGEVDTLNDNEGKNTVSINVGRASIRSYRQGNDLKIIYGNQDQLIVTNGVQADALSYRFNDATLSRESLVASSGTLQATDIAQSQISGSANSDIITATGGSSILNGGAGDDTITVGGGDNTFYYHLGDGQDRYVNNTPWLNSDRVVFGAGIRPEDLRIIGRPWRIQVGSDPNDTITFGKQEQSPQSISTLARFEFEDGANLSYAELLARGIHIQGSENDDVLLGTEFDGVVHAEAGDDRVVGGSGDETIFGDEGNDFLLGGAGNDVLVGGMGADTYELGWSTGSDVLIDASGETGTVVLQSGVTLSNLRHSREGNSLLISISGSDSAVVLSDYYVTPQLWSIRGEGATDTSVADWLSISESVDVGVIWNEFLDNYRKEVSSSLPGYNRTGKDVWERLTVGGTASNRDVQQLVLTTQNGDAAEIRRQGVQYSYDDLAVAEIAIPLSGAAQTAIAEQQFMSIAQFSALLSSIGASGIAINGLTPVYGPQEPGEEGAPLLGFMMTPGAVVIPGATEYYHYRLAESGRSLVLEQIYGGASDNVIDGKKYDWGPQNEVTLVDGGAGNDTLYASGWIGRDYGYIYDAATDTGGLLYGNDGNDTLYGGHKRDWLIGGNGDDYLDGSYSADTYYIFRTEQGTDTVFDTGAPTDLFSGLGGRAGERPRYEELADFYYASQGIDNWSANYTPQEWGPFSPLHARNLVDGLPPLPAADDFEWARKFVDAGLLPADQINFTDGIKLSDLSFAWSREVLESPKQGINWDSITSARDVLEITSAPGNTVRVILPNATDAIGTGIEQFRFDDGTLLSMPEMLALAPARPMHTASFQYRFDGGDGSLWGLADFLGIDFSSAGNADNASVSRDGLDLLLTNENDSSTLRLIGWYGNPDSVPQINVTFADGSVWDADELTERGLIQRGTSDDDMLSSLSGFSNTLIGLAGNDTLNGGVGNDQLDGGVGDDTYLYELGDGVDQITDTGGVDTVVFGAGITSEMLSLGTGSLLIRVGATGQALHIEGFNPDDPYGSIVIEQFRFADGSVLSYKDFLQRGFDFSGTAGDDTLLGTALEDRIDGGAGADSMIGGQGWDAYVVDSSGDTITENVDEGRDTVLSSITYTLGANLENLTLSGSAAINGTGNALDNVLIGNGAANTLTGGAGSDLLDGAAGDDKLIGGTGNDSYVVDSSRDAVTENAGEGSDTVISSISWTLGSNLENLTLTGTVALSGTGNALNNVLTGNAGNNLLDGGTGADTMIGGAGDDTYMVENIGDIVAENANNGTDLVKSSVTYTLLSNVENLSLTGTTAINGTGNALDNVLIGNSSANILTGGAGNDLLEGGAGNDVLTDVLGSALFDGGVGADTIIGGASSEIFLGGLGNDLYSTAEGNDIILFNKGDGQDTFATGGTGSDTISLGGGIAYADLVFTKATSDLVFKVGATDQITFKNWYAATPSKLVANLQVIAEAMTDFAAGGSDPLRDQKVEQFNFAGLVGAFDAARAADSGLTSWALTNALASFQLAGSDTAALGGDLAYQYGQNGTLAGIGVTPALATLTDANLGTAAQTLTPLAGLQTGSVRLS